MYFLVAKGWYDNSFLATLALKSHSKVFALVPRITAVSIVSFVGCVTGDALCRTRTIIISTYQSHVLQTSPVFKAKWLNNCLAPKFSKRRQAIPAKYGAIIPKYNLWKELIFIRFLNYLTMLYQFHCLTAVKLRTFVSVVKLPGIVTVI
jgi:hypothetical protein